MKILVVFQGPRKLANFVWKVKTKDGRIPRFFITSFIEDCYRFEHKKHLLVLCGAGEKKI